MKALFAILPLMVLTIGLNAQSNSEFTDVDVVQFEKMMEGNKNVVILDVRTPQEIAEGKIKGATELNLYDPYFENKVEKLDKSKTYLVYCRSGRRSVSACNIMSKKGFNSLYNLKGGYNDWAKKH